MCTKLKDTRQNRVGPVERTAGEIDVVELTVVIILGKETRCRAQYNCILLLY